MTHAYSGAAFGPDGTSGTTFSSPQGLVFDQGAHELYVVDQAAANVQRFDTTPAPAAFSALGTNVLNGSSTPDGSFAFESITGGGWQQVAVDRSGGAADGNIYVTDTDHHRVQIFAPDGSFLGQLTGAGTTNGGYGFVCCVAVDGQGNVYVADRDQSLIHKYNGATGFPAAAPVQDNDFVRDIPASNPPSLAADASGDLFYVAVSGGAVHAIDPLGTDYTVDDAGSRGTSLHSVAFDPSTGHLFVAEADRVAEYDISSLPGTRLGSFGQADLQAPAGVAVDGQTGDIYVSDTTLGQVLRFAAAPFAIPDAATEPADGVTDSTATLHGSVNPNGVAVTDCHFEFQDGTTPNVPCDQDPGTASSPVEVTGAASGLTPATSYSYRLVAANANGSSAGEWQTFTTEGPPTTDASPAFASDITRTTATVHATVNPWGAGTTCAFSYSDGATTASVPCAEGDQTGYGDREVTANLTGLAPSIAYSFHLVVNNGIGGDGNHDVTSSDTEFRTAPATEPRATDITAVTATVHGIVDPDGQPTSWHFDYGTDTTYGSQTPETQITDTTQGEQAVSAEVRSLTPNTQYHLRLVVNRGGESVTSGDETFTTVQAPTATIEPVTDIGTNFATFHGSADTHGFAGSVSFVVTGTDNPYQESTPAQATSGGTVSATLSDLPSAGSFTVDLVVSAAGTRSFSAPATFQTASPPSYTPPAHRDDAPGSSPYGCTVPQLNPLGTAKPGLPLTVTGSDLGVAGEIHFGSQVIDADQWSATAFTFTVPRAAVGKVQLSVDCGTSSNAISVTVPDSRFMIGHTRVRGRRASITVDLPGDGTLRLAGRYVTTVQRAALTAGTVRLATSLSKAGVRRLRKTRRLVAGFAVTFTPTGGVTNTKTSSLTFRRG